MGNEYKDWSTLTFEQQLDILNGEPPHDAVERARQRSAAKILEGLPIDQWPPFEVIWDLSPEGQKWALDGVRKPEFEKAYPDGLEVEWVRLSDLDRKLTPFSHRTPEEVWGIGDDSKAARVLFEWIEGRPITPPLLHPVSTNQCCLGGGNHRLAVARAKGEAVVPMLIAPSEKAVLVHIVPFLPTIGTSPIGNQS
ncbi:hypothetical protein LWE61_08245 [Sphingobium sufflavum]|uniref:hypothetical protein n=1 Tax=Sphingobium sufflavum TaxID=1129547 RepID=UPI001F3ADA45|nr:hypothetical protein [Sphingobium sufflavum]MCE7796552.1 hypothetical protein [Sphingobium sufflavum]